MRSPIWHPPIELAVSEQKVVSGISRSQRNDCYKRHVFKDLDIGVVRAVGITPVNIPEAAVTEAITADLEPQNVKLQELHILPCLSEEPDSQGAPRGRDYYL